MKMAKASEADLRMAIELANALEALNSHWGATMPEKITRCSAESGDSERFSLDEPDDCRRVCEYLIQLTRTASLFRVVMGMTVLLDPRNKIVDPLADTLEHHPDTQAAKRLVDSGSIGFLYADDREALRREGRAYIYAERQAFTVNPDPGCVPVFAQQAP